MNQYIILTCICYLRLRVRTSAGGRVPGRVHAADVHGAGRGLGARRPTGPTPRRGTRAQNHQATVLRH